MTLILDTFNVLHAWHSAPSGDMWRQIVALGALTRRSPWAHLPAILVCDGPSPDRDRPELAVARDAVALFAGPGADADSRIEALIDASHTPTKLVVVSSDNRIIRAAKRRGATSIDSDTFIRRALASSRSATPDPDTDPESIDPAEIDRWMRAFGVTPPDRPPAPRPKAPSRDERLFSAHDIDPADLDMERWLKSNPPPPRVEPQPPSD